MNNLTCDTIAIDTNVFVHLLNPEKNPGGHIDDLLGRLQQDGISLLVDEGGRIAGEYDDKLAPVIRNSSDEDSKTSLLRYWMVASLNDRTTVAVDGKSKLMVQIKKRITRKTPDSIFVYVALKKQRVLVSNDQADIIGQRAEVRRIEKKSELLTSQEAAERL